MEAYRFETKIPENGIIQVPNFQELKDKNVEVVLLVKKSQIEKQSKEKEAQEFLDKWFGFFSEIDTDDVRYNAIIGKSK